MKTVNIESDKDYLLLPGRLWDGISPGPVTGQAVFISRGVISQIIPTGAICESTMENVVAINLGDTTLMPGLTDCHVHFSMNCQNLFQAIDDWKNRPELVSEKARRAATDYLTNGVLAVRDGSDKMNIGLMTRNNINSGIFPGPAVTATGRAIYRKGRYGSFLGPGISNVKEALEQTETFRAEGIDQLKVIVSGLVSFKNFGEVGPVQFTLDELTTIVEKAHEGGLKVMAHASSANAVETAVKAGVDSVEHGYFLETPQLELMADKSTAWVPTLAPLGNLVKGSHQPYEGADMGVISRSFEIQLKRLKEASDMGVKLGVGTDAGANHVPHGYSYSDELAFYEAAGLNKRDIMRFATSVSADIIGLGNIMGTITPGKRPYLIAVPGDPFESPVSATNPLRVLIPAR